MSTTDTIYQGVPTGIQQMIDIAAGSRNQEAEWLVEDIKLLVTRNPKITTQLFKVAVHHSNAGDLSDIKTLQALYSTLKKFVAELGSGQYPTLLSLHFNDGLAQEGWEPPNHDMAEPTELDTMRSEIHAMKQSPLITKEDLRSLPTSTTDQYVYLKNLIGNRATEMANFEAPVVDDSEPLVVEPKPVERELTAGEAIIERRKLMVQAMLNPSSANPELLAEAKQLIREGSVGLIQEMNRLTTDDVTITTSEQALAYTAKLEGMTADATELGWPDPVPLIDQASQLAAAIKENNVTDTKPAKLTHRLKTDIGAVVSSILAEQPNISLTDMLTHPKYVAAAHAERDTPCNLYDRLMKAAAGIPFPPKALINVMEEPCQSATTAETSPGSSSTPDSKPTESTAPQPEAAVFLYAPPSVEPSSKQDLHSPEKSLPSTMTESSSATETQSAAVPAEIATPAPLTGSTTSSDSGVPTVSGVITSHTTPSTASTPTSSLSTLLQRRKVLENELTVVKTQIAQLLAAEEAEEAALRARLKAIEEAKKALLDG